MSRFISPILLINESEGTAMPIDTTERRRDLARDVISLTDSLMSSLYALAQRTEEAQSAGLTFVDADFEGQEGLTHVNAAMITNVLANAPLLIDHLQANFIDDVFNGARPR